MKLYFSISISTKLTHLSEKERIEQLELDVKCLQLLRGLLHNEIVKLPEDFEGDVKSCKKYVFVIRTYFTSVHDIIHFKMLYDCLNSEYM